MSDNPLDTLAMCITDDDELVFHNVPPEVVKELKRRTQKSAEFFKRAVTAEAERDQLRSQLEAVKREAFDAGGANDAWALEVDQLRSQRESLAVEAKVFLKNDDEFGRYNLRDALKLIRKIAEGKP